MTALTGRDAEQEWHLSAEAQVLRPLARVEADPRLVKQKKLEAIRLTGRLSCEVCGLAVHNLYGPIGDACIECHYTPPLSLLRPVRCSIALKSPGA